jgi:hypothetical protein
VSNSRQGQNADAFDDLLGQLVDELAMTPTMPEEPEVPIGPAPVPGGTVMVAAPTAPHDPAAGMQGQAAYYTPPPPKSSVGLALGIGGGIVVLGSVIAAMVLLREPEKPAEDKTPSTAQTDVKDDAKTDAKADAKADVPPPAPGVVATPGQPAVGQPGAVVPGQPGAVVPGQPGTVVPGQPGAVVPGQPDPAATPTPTPPAALAKKKKRSPKKKKGGGTFDPFAM